MVPIGDQLRSSNVEAWVAWPLPSGSLEPTGRPAALLRLMSGVGTTGITAGHTVHARSWPL